MSPLRALRAEQRPLRLPPHVRLAAVVALVALAAALPLSQPTYVNFDLSMAMVYAVAGLGLNLLTGNTGQLSLGHSAFFAVGSYTAALMIGGGAHYLLTIPVAGVASFALGFVIGLPALRLRGLQLALVTLALALTVPAIVKRLDRFTHGFEGMSVVAASAPTWTGLADDQWRYYLCLAALAFALVVAHRIASGRTGRAMTAVRDNEVVANAMGIRAARLKTLVFATSAAFAAIAGVLYTLVVQFVGPEAFGLTLAVSLVTLIVVGGLGATWGAVLGGLFVVYAPKYLAEVNQSASGVAYGAALIACMFVAPYGLVSLIRWCGRRLRR
ncbi:branched-chain amino acid ABC transporter permease [Xylanimonas ulmi]|uniref:Amino acid/amide ABC transporter membrane protein 2 (HAAT family) n=1 Tax=Xylanimonas ulmi TaxID=228973 RepID=A0A4Q7M3L3_9MICO|nr:branched-chain amino acid ABC transporter permease [Xylanibacterium ulmi]RZS61563.1 amino acid/amide ABC transporter membrane protein 2 (HAAT family) [Xylanibacterium ulmi]